MKGLLITLFIITMVTLPAETDFSGRADVTFTGLLPGKEYSSLLNPENAAGLKELTVKGSFLFKTESWDENSEMGLWVKIKDYPVGTPLSLLSAPEQAGYITGFLTEYGDRINTLDIMRLYITWNTGDKGTLSLGRKQYLLGYGYGWNPADNVNSNKDPQNPDAEMVGVDSVIIEFSPLENLSLRLAGISSPGDFTEGIQYQDIRTAGDMLLSLQGVELLLAGVWEFNEENDSVSSAAAAFKADLRGLGIYSEASFQKGSRNLFPADTGYQRKEQWLFTLLAGAEYTFPTETTVIAEYFLNGEGYDKRERENYAALLIDGNYFPGYKPGFWSRHYGLLNIFQSLYSLNSDFTLTALWSIDTQSLFIGPVWTWNISENSQLQFSYSGFFFFNDKEITEKQLLPMHNVFQVQAQYTF